MRSTAAAWGPLSHRLENARVLAGLRRIVLAWQDPEGEWKHALRCREDMVPQAEARLLEELFRIYSQGHPPAAWQQVMRSWHADRGWFDAFKTADGAGFYAAFCDDGAVRPEHSSEWLCLALPALAASANETERHRSLHIQRQAVLESAAALSVSDSEPGLLLHATRLARRLFTADAAFWLAVEGGASRARPRVLAEDPEGSCPPGGNHMFESLATGKPLIQHGGDTPASDALPCGASLVAVPFRHADSQAVLVVRRDSGRPYSSYDQSTFSVFCRQVEGVLENRRLLTRLKAANLELTATQAQLVESARLQTLGEVAASVAHDINNVLGALLGRVQLLEHACSDAGVLASLGKMERVITDGENTVKRLQEAAQARRTEPRLTLDGLVREVYSTTESVLRNQAQIHDRKVVWLTDFKPTATVVEQPAKMRAVVRQLLTEVSGSAPADSVIELCTRRQGSTDQLLFTVASDPATAGVFEWPVLAAYAALASAMEQQGGELALESKDGVSTLEVRMTGRDKRPAVESGRSFHLRVLVVDDDQEVRDVLRELLVADGHAVFTATDGADALKQFAVGRFDIVFTDLGMPGISGWQVAEHIKRESPGLPVVMVTGWGHQLDPAQVERSGVDRVLTKPFQWLKVQDTLHELVPPARGVGAA